MANGLRGRDQDGCEKLRAALHRGVDTVASTLPDRQGRTLRWNVWSRAYPIEMMKLRPVLVKAIDEASDDMVASELEQLLAMHDLRIEPIHEQAVEYPDEQAAEESRFGPLPEDGRSGHHH